MLPLKFNLGPTVNYYQSYNFQNESWWPKFESLQQKYGIKVVKGDRVQKEKRQMTTNSQPNISKKNDSIAHNPDENKNEFLNRLKLNETAFSAQNEMLANIIRKK